MSFEITPISVGEQVVAQEMLKTLGCTPDQLARSVEEITSNTVAYVGPLVNHDDEGQIVRIFDLLPRGIEYVYNTSYPEGKIVFQDVTIGSKKPEELETELRQRGIKVSKNALDFLRSKKFARSVPKKLETIRTARLRVGDLDLPGNPTINQIYKRIEALGGELCLAAVGPHKRLEDTDQSLGDWYWIAMKPMSVQGHPSIFLLGRVEGGLWLYDHWTYNWIYTDLGWTRGHEFVFALRKDTSKP